MTVESCRKGLKEVMMWLHSPAENNLKNARGSRAWLEATFAGTSCRLLHTPCFSYIFVGFWFISCPARCPMHVDHGASSTPFFSPISYMESADVLILFVCQVVALSFSCLPSYHRSTTAPGSGHGQLRSDKCRQWTSTPFCSGPIHLFGYI